METAAVVLVVLIVLCCVAVAFERYDAMFHDADVPKCESWTPSPGDLVFSTGSVSAVILTSAWTHVGIVLHVCGVPHVFEIVPHLGSASLRRLASKKGRAFRRARVPVDNNRLYRAVTKLRHYRYQHSYWPAWVNRLVVGWLIPMPRPRLQSGTYCSDLVTRVASEAGMLIDLHYPVLPCDMARSTWQSQTWGSLRLAT